MKVSCISHTENPALLIATAGRTCYSKDDPDSIFWRMSNEDAIKLLPKLHGSCFEHVAVTFAIEGISRVTSHQLVRHRIASFSQQSQRYVDVHKTWDNVVIPDSVQDVIDAEDELTDCIDQEPMLKAIKVYEHALQCLIDELDKHKIPSEDIRYFIPQGTKTNLVVTMNVRELMHFLGLRCCTRAQWEIRQVADSMLQICRAIDPELFAKAGPQCVQLGYCPEHKSCGRYKKMTVNKIK